MAKIKFGMMMTDARGKLGGQVFSKNRAGAYVRTKVTPVNPQTAAQMASRQLLGSLSAGWNALTASAIAAWNGAVDSWKSTDIFGDIKVPTGKNLYTALNKNSLQAGGSAIVLPPAKLELTQPGQIRPDIDLTATEINLAVTAGLATERLQVWSSGHVNDGVTYVKNRMRVISYQIGNAIDPEAIYDDYVAKFGTPVVGQRIFFEVRYIGANGQAGLISKGLAKITP